MYSWTIKIGDLLTTPGSEDIVVRENQGIETLSNISNDNLFLKMKLTSVNHGEIWIYIIGLKASFHEVCDYSGVEFIRTLELNEDDEEILRFSLDQDDEVYPINARDNTINILEPITQLIQLYEPISKVAPGYVFEDEDDDWSTYTDEGENHVVFR